MTTCGEGDGPQGAKGRGNLSGIPPLSCLKCIHFVSTCELKTYSSPRAPNKDVP